MKIPDDLISSVEKEFQLLASPLGYVDFHRAKKFIPNALSLAYRRGAEDCADQCIEAINNRIKLCDEGDEEIVLGLYEALQIVKAKRPEDPTKRVSTRA